MKVPVPGAPNHKPPFPSPSFPPWQDLATRSCFFVDSCPTRDSGITDLRCFFPPLACLPVFLASWRTHRRRGDGGGGPPWHLPRSSPLPPPHPFPPTPPCPDRSAWNIPYYEVAVGTDGRDVISRAIPQPNGQWQGGGRGGGEGGKVKMSPLGPGPSFDPNLLKPPQPAAPEITGEKKSSE